MTRPRISVVDVPVKAMTIGKRRHDLATVVAFLLGEGPLDGLWFSDRHPTEKGAFWWRKHLRAALDPPKPQRRDRRKA